MVRDILTMSTSIGSWDARLKSKRIFSTIEQCTVLNVQKIEVTVPDKMMLETKIARKLWFKSQLNKSLFCSRPFTIRI
jgi:hypothetical protein